MIFPMPINIMPDIKAVSQVAALIIGLPAKDLSPYAKPNVNKANPIMKRLQLCNPATSDPLYHPRICYCYIIIP